MKTLNVPNLLSLSRIVFAPFVMVLLTSPMGGPILLLEGLRLDVTYSDIFAGLLFVVAALTDTADGYLARKQGTITNLGKFIDPLSDKILVIAALLALVELQRLPGWMVMIIVARDFVVSGVRMVAAVGGRVIAASPLGKVKTVAQIVAITMMILRVPYALLAMWLCLILTVLSGAAYVAGGWDLIAEE